MTRLRDDRGFTLIELLIATTIGTIVVLASFSLVDLAVDGQTRTDNRIQAVQRGRTAMEQISRQVRAQMCIGKNLPPVLDARDTTMTFYASVAASPTTTTAPPIQRRTLTYVPYPDGSGRGGITETVVTSSGGTPPDLVFPESSRTTRRLVDNISPVPGKPLFRFFKFDPDTSPNMLPLVPDATNGVAEADRKLIVQIQTTFTSWSDGGLGADRVKTELDSKILVRTADPTDPTRSPKCI